MKDKQHQTVGFDNQKYLKLQSEKIKQRAAQFGDKLYLEFGGKLFDDYHASRVLPGFKPDSKMQMLLELKDDAEIIVAISATDLERGKLRGDFGISYGAEVLRLIDAFKKFGLSVCGVCITKYENQPAADNFRAELQNHHIKTYLNYLIPSYPANEDLILSENGFGKNDYIETDRRIVVVTAPGPGSGKMSVCLSQLYLELQRGNHAGYAKFETFPIWNLPLQHEVNLAYEAATADIDDINMLDPYHFKAYGKRTVNYNRDIDIFPVLNSILKRIHGQSPYQSPTDMGVNMAGYCIIDDEICRKAARDEILRRHDKALKGPNTTPSELEKLEFLLRCVDTPFRDQ